MLNVKYRAKKGLLDAKIGCIGHVSDCIWIHIRQ